MIASKNNQIYDSSALRIPLISELVELIRYRHLVANLVSRDLKVRYKRSVIGFIWVMLNPLFTMGVLVFVFSTLFQSKQAHFSTYTLAGLLIWNMFSQGTVAAMGSMQANSATLKKIYVPPSAFVFSSVGSALVNLVFALVPFFGLALFDGILPKLSWLYLLVPAIQATMLTAGIGLLVSSLIVFFADIFEIYQVILNLYFFLTPIMYPISILPPDVAAFERFNPLFWVLSTLRTAIIDGVFPPLEQVVISTSFTGMVLIVGWLVFTKVKDQFAYHI